MSTFSFSKKQKNFYLIGVICVIIILSGMFMLRVDAQDKILNQERIEFTETLTQNFGGKINRIEAINPGTISFMKRIYFFFVTSQIIGTNYNKIQLFSLLDAKHSNSYCKSMKTHPKLWEGLCYFTKSNPRIRITSSKN